MSLCQGGCDSGGRENTLLGWPQVEQRCCARRGGTVGPHFCQEVALVVGHSEFSNFSLVENSVTNAIITPTPTSPEGKH